MNIYPQAIDVNVEVTAELKVAATYAPKKGNGPLEVENGFFVTAENDFVVTVEIVTTSVEETSAAQRTVIGTDNGKGCQSVAGICRRVGYQNQRRERSV